MLLICVWCCHYLLPPAEGDLAQWATALLRACEASFLDAYLRTAEGAEFLLPRGVRRPFLWAYLLDKALYEVRYELGSADWQARVAASKFAAWPAYGTLRRGHIGLQDHGDRVAFRNIRIRELAATAGRAR